MREYHGTWQLDLPDLIRMNQLVRRRVDFEGFENWYAALMPAQRLALTYCLCEFAHQAGVTDAVFEEALAVARLSADHPIVARLLGCRRNGVSGLLGMYEVLTALGDADLAVAFRLFVSLFGAAEGRVYRGERKDWCNHWWHRDLLDERVVRDLLSDPEYYRTAMRDDDRLKR
ncbi:MAG: hypothetical protein JWO38_4397 [Gemmataceae bacterium]|nr:hypothetical protein [Gemmataceae bacterium]